MATTETNERRIQFQLVQGTQLKSRPRIIAMAGGERLDVVELNLVSDRSRGTYGRRLANTHRLPTDVVLAELNRLAIQHAALLAQNQVRRDGKIAEAPRVQGYIISAIRLLEPLRKNRTKKTVYFGRLGYSVPYADVAALLAGDEEFVDGIAETKEGLEASGSDGRPAGYEAAMRILRCAIQPALLKAVAALPDEFDGDSEEEVGRQEAIQKLVTFLHRQRTYRAEHGEVVSNTYAKWATRLERGPAWRMFPLSEFYARQPGEDGVPEMAVNSNVIAGEARYSSAKAFVVEMQAAGLGEANRIRIGSTVKRAFVLTRAVIIEAIGEAAPNTDNDNNNHQTEDAADNAN